MKKKLVLLLLLTSLTMSACSPKSESTEPIGETSSIDASIDNTELSGNDALESEHLSDPKTIDTADDASNLFTVEIHIPQNFVGETTQNELDQTAQQNGYDSITLNDDGSANYIMSKKKHNEMMDDMKNRLNDTLAEMVGSEDYPNFTNIETNEDFTDFAISTKSTELGLNESITVMLFYMYGGMYNLYNNTPVDNVKVTFINADTGEVISTTNSSDLPKE